MTDQEFSARQTNNTSTALALRQQGAGCAGLVAVALPAPCHVQTVLEAQPLAIRFLRMPEVIARVGLKRAAIYLHISKDIFPKQIALGPRAVGWLEHEIEAWLAAKIEAATKRHV